MTIQSVDLAHFLLAVTVILVAAHTTGYLFMLLRQPIVIGEILGGLLLGPTVLGQIAPGLQEQMFPKDGVVGAGIGVLYEAGLLLLLFLSGHEMMSYQGTVRRKSVAYMTIFGLVLPFAAGILVVRFVDTDNLTGPNGTKLAVGLIFAIAFAVTSIPVISRIMLDLGILQTGFARVVLSVAVIEDIVLYVALAVVLGMTQAQTGSSFGLWSLFDNDAVVPSMIYYVVVSLVFFGVFLLFGRPAYRAVADSRVNAIELRSSVAFRLVFLLVMTLICVSLGINPVFGALVGGVVAARADAQITDPLRKARVDDAWGALSTFSLAFFIPLYFAGVGLKLDLARNFSILFFVVFFALACLVKLLSVWLGARLAGEPNRSAMDYAIALNARGGPGIVLATVTFAAGVISENFFTVLAMLAIVTSEASGAWLHFYRDRVVATHAPKTEDSATVSR